MNKRIKEMTVLAGYKPLEPKSFADDLHEVFLQKFAELIIKECADVCRRFGESGDGYTCSAEIFRTFRS